MRPPRTLLCLLAAVVCLLVAGAPRPAAAFAVEPFPPPAGSYAPGHFLTTDPVDSARSPIPHTWNKYAFVWGNPLRYIDPHGMEPDDSVSRSLEAAIKSGDADAIEGILEAGEEELPKKLVETAKAAIQRLRAKASKIIEEECKGSINREFPEEMREKTYEEICKAAKEGSKVAKKAKKLLTDTRFKK